MDEKNANEAKPSKKREIILGIALGTVGLLAAVYVGLCAYVSASDTVLPGVSAGGADVSGMTREQAARAVESAAQWAYSRVEYTLHCGESTEKLSGTLVQVDSAAAAEQAFRIGRDEMFLKRGAEILAHLMSWESYIPLEASLSQEGEQALEQALDQLSRQEGSALVETVWTVEDNVLILRKGVTGAAIDRDQARRLVLEAVKTGRSQTVELPLEKQAPEETDIQQIYDAVHVEPQNAYVEETGSTVAPHVVGLSFDVEKVRSQFNALPEGETMRVELTQTMPEVTQEQLLALLFSDVLGECTTHISGSSNRLSNVILAAQFINGVILMPGDVFSYNDTVGARTSARGFLPAPAYVGGKTVDEVGGGICQDSSTLYLAALRANLTIVERTNHMYAVGYVPDGMDATVAWGAIDFKFQNSTNYPIRIDASVTGREITVTLHGTKTDDITVKMTNKVISTNPAQTVYKADESVPQGTTVVEVTPYNGRRVEAYRNLYDGQGNLISSTLESTNRYNRRDKVIRYNPADAASLGLAPADDPSQGTILPVNPPEEPGGDQTGGGTQEPGGDTPPSGDQTGGGTQEAGGDAPPAGGADPDQPLVDPLPQPEA